MKWLRWLRRSQPESDGVQLARLKELCSDLVARRRRMNPDLEVTEETLMDWLEEPELWSQPRSGNPDEVQLARLRELRSDVVAMRRRLNPDRPFTKGTLKDEPEQPGPGPQTKRKN